MWVRAPSALLSTSSGDKLPDCTSFCRWPIACDISCHDLHATVHVEPFKILADLQSQTECTLSCVKVDMLEANRSSAEASAQKSEAC